MQKAWIFRTIGNILYRLNGRLESIHKENRRAKIMYWAWQIAYFAEEKAMGRLPPLTSHPNINRREYPNGR